MKFETFRDRLIENGVEVTSASLPDGWEIRLDGAFRFVWNEPAQLLLLQRPSQGPESWNDAGAVPNPTDEQMQEFAEQIIAAHGGKR